MGIAATAEQVDAIGYVGGALLAGCFLPQIVRVIATRSVQDISILWSVLYTSGLALTTIYLVFKDAPAAWIPSLFELLGGLLVLALKLFFDNTPIGQRMCAERLQQQQLQQQQEQTAEAEPKDSESKKDHPPLDKAIALRMQQSLKLSLPSSPTRANSIWKLGPGTPSGTGSNCGSPLAAYSSSGFSSMFSAAAAAGAAASGCVTLEGGPSRPQQHLHKRGSTHAVSTWDLEVSIDPAAELEPPWSRGLSAPGSFHKSGESHTPAGAARSPTKLQWAGSSNSRAER